MEIWKDIVGYEGLYQVSNTGKVRSLDRKQKDKNGRVVSYVGKELQQTPNSQGYLRVELKRDGESEKWFVHRLVAIHFVDNPQPDLLTIVNHIDSNHKNNFDSNLEWTTIRGNNLHAIKNGRMDRTEMWLAHLRESNEINGKSVVGVDENAGKIVFYICLNDCAKDGFTPASVCECCKGKRKTHKGMTWSYVPKDEIANLKSLWSAKYGDHN